MLSKTKKDVCPHKKVNIFKTVQILLNIALNINSTVLKQGA